MSARFYRRDAKKCLTLYLLYKCRLINFQTSNKKAENNLDFSNCNKISCIMPFKFSMRRVKALKTKIEMTCALVHILISQLKCH